MRDAVMSANNFKGHYINAIFSDVRRRPLGIGNKRAALPAIGCLAMMLLFTLTSAVCAYMPATTPRPQARADSTRALLRMANTETPLMAQYNLTDFDAAFDADSLTKISLS